MSPSGTGPSGRLAAKPSEPCATCDGTGEEWSGHDYSGHKDCPDCGGFRGAAMTAIERIEATIARCSVGGRVPSEVMVEVADLREVVALAKKFAASDRTQISMSRKMTALQRKTAATCETCALLVDLADAGRYERSKRKPRAKERR